MIQIRTNLDPCKIIFTEMFFFKNKKILDAKSEVKEIAEKVCTGTSIQLRSSLFPIEL